MRYMLLVTGMLILAMSRRIKAIKKSRILRNDERPFIVTDVGSAESRIRARRGVQKSTVQQEDEGI